MIIEPDYSKLLDDVHAFIGRFVIFPSDELHDAVAVWVAHTWMIEAFDTTPRLALLSPEPGSGKSRVLEIFELLCFNPMHVLNASAPAIFRSLHEQPTTLLLDEVDTIFHSSAGDSAEALRSIINAGYRRGATVPRVSGKDHTVERFEVFSAVALAGLGLLPDTIMTRSIIIRMRKRAPHEVVEPFRRRDVADEAEALRGRLEKFARARLDQARDCRPDLPDGVIDRAADVWEPLVIVADLAGGDWPKRIRASASAATSTKPIAEASVGVRLLSDIRTVFGGRDRVPTEDLLGGLYDLDDSIWSDFEGRLLNARRLAELLRPYGVEPTQFWVDGQKRRGYQLAGESGLRDPFDRYLTAA